MVDKKIPGGRILLIIGLLFVIPMLLAIGCYYHNNWLPKRSLNHGHLLTPPPSLLQLSINPQILQHHWAILYLPEVAGSKELSCDSICQKNLYNIQQIQRALGKDMNRLQRVLVIMQPGEIDQPLQKRLTASETLYWRLDPNQLVKVLGPAKTFYVVDPLGNIVLSYSAEVSPDWILDDLKYLMGVSSIG